MAGPGVRAAGVPAEFWGTSRAGVAAVRPAALLRLAAFVGWTLLLHGAWRCAPVRRRPAVVRAWARGALRVFRVHVRRRGVPPAQPMLVAANHLGYLDVLVLLAELDAVFVAKADVRRWPLFGALAASVGTVFVQRGRAREALRLPDAIAAALASGRHVVLFPEGTSTDGTRVLPFASAPFAWAAAGRRPVAAAALSYATGDGDPPARTAVCWWGDMPFAGHLLGLCTLRRIEAHLSFGPAPLVADERRALAARLHAAVSLLRTPASAGHRGYSC